MSSTTAMKPMETTDTLHSRGPRQVANYKQNSSSEDKALEASRLADSTAPDGGYGWVVVFGGAILFWWSVGTTYSFGVIEAVLVEDGLAGPAALSFIGGVQACLVSVFAIMNARLIRYIGV